MCRTRPIADAQVQNLVSASSKRACLHYSPLGVIVGV